MALAAATSSSTTPPFKPASTFSIGFLQMALSTDQQEAIHTTIAQFRFIFGSSKRDARTIRHVRRPSLNSRPLEREADEE
jgi:hypothetical protein